MDYTQEQIDSISVKATELTVAEFEDFGTENPPEITPGIVRNVLLAAVQLTVQTDGQASCSICHAWRDTGHKTCGVCGKNLRPASRPHFFV